MKVSKEIKKHVHVLTGTWIERERGAVDTCRVEEREEGHGEVKSRTERALGEGQR